MDEHNASPSGFQFTGSFWGGSWTSPVDSRKQLEPLIAHLRRYDSIRIQMEREGGMLSDVSRIMSQLSRKIQIQGRFHELVEATMRDQASLRRMLFDVGGYDVHISIRRLDSGMPVYYLCRIRRDFWSEYALIVEDLYRSPGYPATDGRFMKLMTGGHEVYHLRLSQFRNGAAGILGSHGEESGSRTDEFLYNLGRNVFQSAWHEDQRPAFLAAGCMRLPHFKDAVELLYLCLSGDLCELRGAIDREMLDFFDKIYPNPFLKSFLSLLPSLEGAALNSLPEKALKLYCRLSRSFSTFLQNEVKWGNRNSSIPLYKLVYSNLYRLNRIAPLLTADEMLLSAANRLENEAKDIAKEILQTARQTV